MLKNVMEDSRLDLDAPLLSVRRFVSEPVTAQAPPAPGDPNPNRSTLPFYKSDLKSGPVSKPGVVPFVWEQSPGQPKPSASVTVRTLRNLMEVVELQPLPSQHQEDEDEDDVEFADALENLSRTESYFLNCSETSEASRSFSSEDRNFMMDRFLPAAKAMSAGSALPSEREISDRSRTRGPLSYQYGPYYIRDGNADKDDDCYESNVHFMGKACGLIPNFCFKTSFCLLNPVPGMKVPNRRMVPKRIGTRKVKEYVGQAEEEYSWETVYKHRITQTHSSKGEIRRKITSESDRVGVSPNRNEPSQFSFCKGKGFLGVPKRESKNYKSMIQSAGEDSARGVESRRMEESLVLETCHRDVLQPKLSEHELKVSLERSIGGVTDENNGIKHHDAALPLIKEDRAKNDAESLFPLPLPNSPSESWLSHALPSVSSKNPSAQSFLGFQIHPKKRVIDVSSADVKLKASAKTPQCGLTRFAEMLEMPLSP